MYSSNNPKLSQHTRQEIYSQYRLPKSIRLNQQQLANKYGVSRPTISKIIHTARDGIAKVGSPVNHRYLTESYVKKRQARIELVATLKAQRKVQREQIKASRYEHKQAGDLGHIDLKLLSPILGEKVIKGQKEYLLSLVDDSTRTAYFTIIQGKNQYQVARALEELLVRCPIHFKAILSDNGKEFKGVQQFNPETGKYKPKIKSQGQTHAVELLLEEKQVKHRYTRVRRPQTNGKVERLNRTISNEFLTKVQFENRLHRICQLRLWEYHYNRERNHQGINNLTPQQKLTNLSTLKFM